MTLRDRGIGVGVAALARLTRTIGRRSFSTLDGARGEEIDPAAVRRILVVRLDEIGDAVLNVPLMRALRRHFPESHITAVMRPAGAALMAPSPYVDTLHTLEGPAYGASRIPGRYRRALAFAREHLDDWNYDLAVVPRWEVDKYFATGIAYWSGARWRVGYSEHVSPEKETKNRGWDSLLTNPLPGGHGQHEVRRALATAGFVGAEVDDDALELWTTPEDEAAAERLLADAGVAPGTPLVALAPGAGLARREWPAARLADVATRLLHHDGLRPLILGGSEDRRAGQMMAKQIGTEAVDLTGKATIRQTVALLRRSRLFVGNDSGPMHLGAAVSLPIVVVSCHPMGGDIEHHNAPERFGPWRTPSVVLRPESARPPCETGCGRDEPHCILDVSTDSVYAAALTLLSNPSTRRTTGVEPMRAAI